MEINIYAQKILREEFTLEEIEILLKNKNFNILSHKETRRKILLEDLADKLRYELSGFKDTNPLMYLNSIIFYSGRIIGYDETLLCYMEPKIRKLLKSLLEVLRRLSELESELIERASENDLKLVIRDKYIHKKTKNRMFNIIDNLKNNRLYSDDKGTILYYLKIKHNDKFYYKIGFTKRSVRERYSAKSAIKIESILFESSFEHAEDLEICILMEYQQHRVYDYEIFPDGYTEIFDRDVLELDKKNII